MRKRNFGRKAKPGCYMQRLFCLTDITSTCVKLEKHYEALLTNQISATSKARKSRAAGDEEAAKSFEELAEKYRRKAKAVKNQLETAKRNRASKERTYFK